MASTWNIPRYLKFSFSQSCLMLSWLGCSSPTVFFFSLFHYQPVTFFISKFHILAVDSICFYKRFLVFFFLLFKYQNIHIHGSGLSFQATLSICSLPCWLVVLFYSISTLFGSFIVELNHFDKSFKQLSKAFVYTQLNIKTVLFQTIQFSISTQFKNC